MSKYRLSLVEVPATGGGCSADSGIQELTRHQHQREWSNYLFINKYYFGYVSAITYNSSGFMS